MKLFNKMKFCYHLTKAEKALLNGDKDKYEKHTTIVTQLLWNTINESR